MVRLINLIARITPTITMQTTPGPNYKKEVVEMAAGLLVLSTIILIGFFVNKGEPEKKTTPERQPSVVVTKKTEPRTNPEPETVANIASSTVTTTPPVVEIKPPAVDTQPPIGAEVFEYIEVTDSCGFNFEGDCLRVRSGPGTDYPVVASLRNGMVLRIDDTVLQNDTTWHKIIFDEWLRYPERVAGDWYVAADYVRSFRVEGEKTIEEHGHTSTTKRILVDRSEQKLYAYDGDILFTEQSISTGLELTPTPRGTFTVYKKTPSRYMQGPLPYLIDQQRYDLPGVPWNLYFTEAGAVIHGAYWHNSFGKPYSHGCVNLPPQEAQKIYLWAELGTTVTVQD